MWFRDTFKWFTQMGLEMVDLGIDARPEPRWPGSTASRTQAPEPRIEADWLAQLLITITYFVTIIAIVIGWMIAAGVAGSERDFSGLLTMLIVTIISLPGFALLESIRVAVRMLCVIARGQE